MPHKSSLAAIESKNRNNALLAEVERTLHPLFPLSVDVRFRAQCRPQNAGVQIGAWAKVPM